MNISTILQILDRQPGAYFQLHFEGYAEPGYNDPESGLITTGNWNPSGKDNTMPRIGAILEKLGVELEWEDEWCECSECGKLVRTQPDSYSWTRSYWLHDGIGLYCQDCVLDDPEVYLEYLEGNPKTANTLDLDLGGQGYVKTEGEYENGFHSRQNDDPEVIAKSLRKLGINRFIFEIDGTGQFDIAFSVWVHKSEYSKLDSTEIDSEGVDIAAAMQTALQDASAKLTLLDGPGVKVAKCHLDGTATAKLVSEQDFIDGKALN